MFDIPNKDIIPFYKKGGRIIRGKKPIKKSVKKIIPKTQQQKRQDLKNPDLTSNSKNLMKQHQIINIDLGKTRRHVYTRRQQQRSTNANALPQKPQTIQTPYYQPPIIIQNPMQNPNQPQQLPDMVAMMRLLNLREPQAQQQQLPVQPNPQQSVQPNPQNSISIDDLLKQFIKMRELQKNAELPKYFEVVKNKLPNLNEPNDKLPNISNNDNKVEYEEPIQPQVKDEKQDLIEYAISNKYFNEDERPLLNSMSIGEINKEIAETDAYMIEEASQQPTPSTPLIIKPIAITKMNLKPLQDLSELNYISLKTTYKNSLRERDKTRNELINDLQKLGIHNNQQLIDLSSI